jgi:hypothetical protein
MRYVTNEQRRRRTLFKPTRRADGAFADFLRCSFLTDGFKYARRSRLEIGKIGDGGMPPTYENRGDAESPGSGGASPYLRSALTY